MGPLARLIDGKAVAAELREGLKARCVGLAARGITPGLAVILVGDDLASRIYVRNKERACASVGIHTRTFRFPAETEMGALKAQIDALNADDSFDGILLQLPLPQGLCADELLERIAPEKDVDGFHPLNFGKLALGLGGKTPCTPAGCMELLRRAGVDIAGKEAVVIGRSRLVGKPTALLLQAADATVTLCHSHTRDLAAHTRRADILVVAAGKAGLVTGEMIKPGAAVIDVGINRRPDGTLCGDVEFSSAEPVAGAITPVPGGVGPMTIAMLLKATIDAAEERRG